jgi:predicted ATPase
LSDHERTALETASVIGRGFGSTILAGALELDELELEEQLDTLVRGRLIERLDEDELPDGSPNTRYRFVNTLTQEVLYEELPKRQRSLLHRRIGEVLVGRHADQAPRIAAQLAMHFEQGRDLPEAIGFLIEAGRNAARLYAHGEASEHLDRALRLAGRLEGDERAELTSAVHQARGGVNLALSRLDAAADDFRFVVDRARSTGNDRREARALAELGNALFFSWRVEETAIHANEALQAAYRSGDESARIEALALVALVVLEDGGQLTEVKLLLEDLIGSARR